MADFQIPESPEFSSKIRKLEPADRAHADLFNAVFQQLLNNEEYLHKGLEALLENIEKIISEKLTGASRVKIGPIGTELETGDTLFVTDGELPSKLEAAAFTNIVFNAASPERAEYWARMPPEEETAQAAEEGTGNVPVTTGKLAVSQEPPADAAFFAKI